MKAFFSVHIIYVNIVISTVYTSSRPVVLKVWYAEESQN